MISHASLSWPLDDGSELGMVLRQYDSTAVEEMVVALARAPTAEETASLVWTPPDALARASVGEPELVDDGGDATLGRHKSTEREDAFANDGSFLDPVCQVQIKGLNIKCWCTVSRSRVPDSPPHARTEEKSARAPVDECDNRDTEELVVSVMGRRRCWTSSSMPYASWLEGMGVIGCLCARLGAQTSLRLGGNAWESSVGMTRDSRWHSVRLLRLSIDARLPRTNREVYSDLNDTQICMASASGSTHVSRSVVFFFLSLFWNDTEKMSTALAQG